MKKYWFLAMCFATTGIMCQAQNQIPGYVINSSVNTATTTVSSGGVAGYLENGIYTFKGIPYAEAGRFELPHAPEAWKGVRSSRSYGPVCPQDVRTGWEDDASAFYFRWNDGFPGEDCLRINIWSPGLNDGKKRPVMFWIHGGGFAAGSGQEHPGYDGHNLAAKGDVVVVTINHRLNTLGFLDLSAFGDQYKYTGNLGMLDIVEALKWVKKNITAFGGDPDNVTIFGQSGGGGKVSTLMCMPDAKGLFHKAIVQSGSMIGCMSKEYAQEIGKRTVELLGLDASSIDQIKKVPYKKLLAANKKATELVRKEAEKKGKQVGMMFGWAPVVDDAVLPDAPFTHGSEMISKDIPMMIGSTINEFAGFRPAPDVNTWEDAQKQLAATYGKHTASIIREFRQAYPEASPKDIFLLDVIFRPGVIEQATIKSKDGGAPVYTYMFAFQSPVLDGKFHAAHCAEIPFAFNNVIVSASMTGATPEAIRLGDQMSDAWLNFARTGNPNTPKLPVWDAYTPDKGALMFFDAPVCKVLYNHDKLLMEEFEKSKIANPLK